MLTGELSTVSDALTRLAAQPAWSRSDAHLLADCAALHVLEQRVAGLKLGLLGELDERGLPREAGATSTVAWLRWRWRISGGPAASTVRLARALRRHPATRDRLLAGDINVEQARTIVEALDALPDDLRNDFRDDRHDANSADRGESGDSHNNRDNRDNRDTGDTGDRAHSGHGADCGDSGDTCDTCDTCQAGDRADNGVTAIAAPAGGWIVARVEGLLLSHAQSLGPRELRIAGRHALTVIAPDIADEAERRALDRADARARQMRRFDLQDDGFGGTVIRGYLDREGATILRTALDPLSGPRGVGDERTAGQRRADALTDICHKVLSGGDLPARGGQPTRLVVTTSFDALTRVLGVGHSDDGEALSAAAVRRLACDAAILPAVLSGEGQVLDVGRTRRLFSGPARRALAIRDQGCSFPGCDRPAAWTEAHHMLSWLDGGPTDVDNGVLVCRVHHRFLHEPDGWRVRLGKDGLPEFVPPPWIDPEQRPMRNTRHRIRAP